MSLPWVIIGTALQLLLAMGLFLLAVVSGAGIANRYTLSKPQVALLDLSLYLLPLSCAAAALLVLGDYWSGGHSSDYWWYALPGGALAGYLSLALLIGARAPRSAQARGSARRGMQP